MGSLSFASPSTTASISTLPTRRLRSALQQNVNLPGNQSPQIQQSSLTGEIFRYEVTGPQHFGLTNLRTIEDWIVARRLLTIPGVVQINAWGGTTKEFHVEADPARA